MEQALPLDELARFTRQERELLDQAGLAGSEKPSGLTPSRKTVQFLLSHSKALSVRQSDTLEHIEVVLN